MATNGDTPKPVFTGLSSDEIQKLMGASRIRNLYGPKLLEFVESDEAGINPAEVWPVEFGKKLPSSLYQGFLNAAKKAKLEDAVMVLKREESVYLLHKERVAALTTEA